MTPAARVQAAIDLLESIVAAARDSGAAADTLIARYFAERRYAGSKDRRAVRELVYAAIRRLGERPESGRAAMLALAADRPGDRCPVQRCRPRPGRDRPGRDSRQYRARRPSGSSRSCTSRAWTATSFPR